MTTASVSRRAPVQERSRQTVTRILDAAAAIADEQGVDAVTTRAIADRAGVSYPSLYRFFADREAILDELLQRHVAELDARCEEAERSWTITSVAGLLNAELDLHVHYYRLFPGSARLWMGGRTSPTVTKHVRARMRNLADRIHTMLVTAGLIPPDTDPRTLLVAVEMADRVLELSFRGSDDIAASRGSDDNAASRGSDDNAAYGGSDDTGDAQTPDFDQEILDIGRRALIAFASDLSQRPPT